MRLRNLKDKEELLLNCAYLIKNPFLISSWNKEFQNENPIHLEIGMGKGDFIYNMASLYPDINFIGLEKYSGVIARAIKKHPNPLPNLRIINMDAKELSKIMHKEINTIYLNFSDPWPKKRNAKKRLTSEEFLKIYDEILTNNSKIIMKTDNINLFAYSIESLSKHGYWFPKINLDLTKEESNVITEYEKKFRDQNIKINYLEATK